MKTIVTFTGIDSKTDIGRLCDLQKKYPEAEFGVLFSETRNGKENRYPEFKSLMKELDGLNLNLALHVCGRQVRAIIENRGISYGTDSINPDLLLYTQVAQHRFISRLQLNGIPPELLNCSPNLTAPAGIELIIQQSTQKPVLVDRFDRLTGDFSILVDDSGGVGIESKFEPFSYKRRHPQFRIGYAGGIGPENVMRKLGELALIDAHNWWIDMETKVRTDDWFDLDKVQSILEQMFPGR